MGDHRLAYLDYEGPVSNDRGTVTRVDAGTFTWLRDDAVELAVELSGQVYRGRMTVTAGRAVFGQASVRT
jgi:hypothetical protein